MDRGSEKTLLQRRHTNGQQVHENVLNITNFHEGNTGQNPSNEITPHTSRIAAIKRRIKMLVGKDVERRSLCILLLREYNRQDCYYGKQRSFLKKIKNRANHMKRQFHFWAHVQLKYNRISRSYVHSDVHCGIIQRSQYMKTP